MRKIGTSWTEASLSQALVYKRNRSLRSQTSAFVSTSSDTAGLAIRTSVDTVRLFSSARKAICQTAWWKCWLP